MDFSPRALIDREAFRHNLTLAAQRAPDAKVMAVIKADAYGHGVATAAEALADADGFAVARCDEGLQLRGIGVDKPILVMGGAYDREAIWAAEGQDLTLAVHHLWQLELLEGTGARKLPRCIIKVDSGMCRLGLRPEDVEQALIRMDRLGCLGESPMLMTHMANADDPDDPKTSRQWECFRQLVERFGTTFSVSNSALTMGRPEMQGSWVRPGIMLYGASPFIDSNGPELGLKPAMTLQAPLIAVKTIRKGDSVGYGSTWTAPEDMPLGVVGIGYGDGYPRHAPSGTPVLLNGVLVPLAGRVSMDMITVDLREAPDAAIGDMATIWGQGLPADIVAKAAGTIAYQLFCNVTGRVDFIAHGQS